MNSRIRRPLYISLKSWLCCCSLPTVAPQQQLVYNVYFHWLRLPDVKIRQTFSNILVSVAGSAMQQTAKRRQFKSRSVNHKQREQSADKPLWTNFKFIPYSLAQLVLCALGTVCLHCSITTHPGYSSTFLTWLRIKHTVCLASRLIRSVSRSVEKHNILQVRHSRLSLKWSTAWRRCQYLTYFSNQKL